MASGAGVILADEPTGNLDQVNTGNVMEVFKTLTDKHKKCVIVVTHSDEIATYADEVISIDKGALS